MTTPRHGTEGPDGLTAESEALLARFDGYLSEARAMGLDVRAESMIGDQVRRDLPDIEAAAIARHVRETGCEGYVERLARYLHDERIKVGTCGDPWSGEGWDDHIGWHEAEARRILASPATEEVERG